MVLSTKIIKAKIGTVKNIKKITKAMEMVATAKMKKTVTRAVASRPFSELALELLENISAHQGLTHSLLKDGAGKKNLIVIISSNKGLCGGFNVALNKEVLKFIQQSGLDFDLAVVGRKGESIARRLGKKPVASFIDLADNLSERDAGGVANFVRREFLTGTYKQVVVVYNRFVSPLVHRPIVRTVLPVKAQNVRMSIEDINLLDHKEEVRVENISGYLFEPSSDEVLDEILPKLSEILLYQALLESLASEHSARMVAMKSAYDNADKLLGDLLIWYNQSRQAAITQEIAEVVAGSNR